MSAEAAGEGGRSHDAHLKTKAVVAISQNPLIAEIKPTTELTALRQTESRDSCAVTPLADIIDRSVQTPVARFTARLSSCWWTPHLDDAPGSYALRKSLLALGRRMFR